MTQPDQATPPKPADQASTPALGAVEAALRANPAAAQGGSGPGQEAQPEPSTPEEITVDYGGAKRKVKVAELVEAHKARSELQSQQETLKSLLKQASNLPELQELHKRIEGLDDNRRRKLVALFRGEPDDDDNEPDDLVDQAVEGAMNGHTQDLTRRELDELKKIVHALAQDTVERRQRDQQGRVEQEVDRLLDSFEDLKVDPKAREAAREGVLHELALRKDANPEQVAAKHAARLKEIMGASRRNTLGAALSTARGTLPPAPEKPFSGADLSNGRIRDAVAAALGQL